MKDNYGSRYRFYEIMQAHKNGEDLSQFTPKNKPEEELIAQLQGGTGGSTGGGMPDISLNNPDLPNLYYGMLLKDKTTLKINLEKMAAFEYYSYYKWNGIVGTGSTSANFDINLFSAACFGEPFNNGGYSLLLRVMGNQNVFGKSCGAVIYATGPSFTNVPIKYVEMFENGTAREYLERMGENGVIELTIDSIFYTDASFAKPNSIIWSLAGYDLNLNDSPIDWLEIE